MPGLIRRAGHGTGSGTHKEPWNQEPSTRWPIEKKSGDAGTPLPFRRPGHQSLRRPSSKAKARGIGTGRLRRTASMKKKAPRPGRIWRARPPTPEKSRAGSRFRTASATQFGGLTMKLSPRPRQCLGHRSLLTNPSTRHHPCPRQSPGSSRQRNKVFFPHEKCRPGVDEPPRTAS